MTVRIGIGAAALAGALTVVGCSNAGKAIEDMLPAESTRYQSSSSLPPLEVPPGLSSGAIRDSYEVPGNGSGSATYSEYAKPGGAEAGTQVASVRGVLPVTPDIRVERSGDKRWLTVRASPGEIWPRLRDFWIENGFLIGFEDASIGIMETGWAEKRQDLPVGAIRRLLAKVNTAAYSFATRDKFRVRLERGAEPGTTELFVSHRGAEEKSQGDSYVWVPRPADPELEAEMLNRIMVAFGLEEERATSLIAASRPNAARAHLVKDSNGDAVLALRESFSRAWRRTGLALDRVGFTVEDRDRSRGLFYVRYVDPANEPREESKSWLGKLKFWGSDDPEPQREFLISLVGSESTTQVLVLDKEGKRERSGTGERILSLLHEQLR